MIRISSRSFAQPRLAFHTATLWENMVSPLCGILTHIFAYHRQTFDPKGIALGGQLTDVASYKGLKGPMSYHIGGMGMNREDAMIKCLAESYERYISVICDPLTLFTTRFEPYDTLLENCGDDGMLAQSYYHYFSAEQLKQPNFFTKFDSTKPMLWVKARELIKNTHLWIPAQLLCLGYRPQKERGENHINAAVSTGTAVHVNMTECVLNSLLEIILLDAAIGHWYTDHPAYKIIPSARTRHIDRIVQKSIPHQNLAVEFYWIPSIDFCSFNVACIVRSHTIPYFSIGLGADATLEGAMYKAFLEYIGTRFLGHTLALLQESSPNPEKIENLDDNLASVIIYDKKIPS